MKLASTEMSKIIDRAIRHEITWGECEEMIEELRQADEVSRAAKSKLPLYPGPSLT